MRPVAESGVCCRAALLAASPDVARGTYRKLWWARLHGTATTRYSGLAWKQFVLLLICVPETNPGLASRRRQTVSLCPNFASCSLAALTRRYFAKT